jgi:hypothetical protein
MNVESVQVDANTENWVKNLMTEVPPKIEASALGRQPTDGLQWDVNNNLPRQSKKADSEYFSYNKKADK